jgi:hypothetical protein
MGRADSSNSLIDVDDDYPRSFLKPHPRFRDGMKQMPWKVLGALLMVAVVSITVASVAYSSTDTIPCLVGDHTKDPPEEDGDKFGMIVTLNLVLFFWGHGPGGRSCGGNTAILRSDGLFGWCN